MHRIIGLTGLIGTGKSTIAILAARLGVPVHDADACVHALYCDKKIQKMVLNIFPSARNFRGGFDRRKLLDGLRGRPDRKARLEALMHPLVQRSQMDFLRRHKRAKKVVLDVPLLFEAGMDAMCDEVWFTKSRSALQRSRVLRRIGFDKKKLDTILQWQGNGRRKENLADHVLNMGMSKARLVRLLQKRL